MRLQLRHYSRIFERLTAGNKLDLGYEIYLEKADVRLAKEEAFHPMILRVMHLYRRESDKWKLIQRHADFLTSTNG